MTAHIRMMAGAGFLLAIGSSAASVPAQMFPEVEDGSSFTSSGRLQQWENDKSGVDCIGECPDGSNNCCTMNQF